MAPSDVEAGRDVTPELPRQRHEGPLFEKLRFKLLSIMKITGAGCRI